jgi:hypothetical protein
VGRRNDLDPLGLEGIEFIDSRTIGWVALPEGDGRMDALPE